LTDKRGETDVKKTNEEYSILYDFYAPLLSERQREVFELYNEENLSLSEIGANIGVSRQAVHIAVSKAGEELAGYEEKLGLIAKHKAYEKAQAEINMKADAILKDKGRKDSLDPETAKALRRIKKLVKELDI